MSSDLLKEFGDLTETPKSGSLTNGGATNNDIEEDDFGEFEKPESQGKYVIAPAEKFYTPNVNLHNAVASCSYQNPRFTPQLHSQPDTSGSLRRQSANQAEVEDGWGEFKDQTLLFDADSTLQSRKPVTGNTALEKADSATPPPLLDEQFDAWDPEDAPPPAVSKEALQEQVMLSETHTKPTSSFQRVKALGIGPPPANIPPPSILISLSATLVSSMPSEIKEIITPDYEELDQARIDQLQHLISTLYAIARVISGRKLRWKRDNLLSQSMKIGPAGKQGSMKLTGVDKTESRREDQEAAELVRLWKQRVGPLRSTLATVNVHLPDRGLVLPEIFETMPVRAGMLGEGTVTAPKACFLCGLKRDERVLKVDVDVQDSFGEWWIEHWGHVDCVRFWDGYKGSLAQR